MCESNTSEEMTSFDVLPSQNGIPESLDSSEFSLIEDHHLLGEQQVMSNSVHSTLMSATQDLSEEEMESRLVELIEDNRSMREALNYNTQMMKEQLNTITSWHSQISTAMSQQQISLNEANKKIEELKVEKVALEGKLQESEAKQDSIVKNESAVLSDEEAEYEIIQKKVNIQKYLDEIKESENRICELEQMAKKQSLEIEELKSILEDKDQENQNLALQLEEQAELKAKYDTLTQQSCELQQLRSSDSQKLRQLEIRAKDLEEKLSLKEVEKVARELACSDGGDIRTYDEQLIQQLKARISELESQLNEKQDSSKTEQELTCEMLLEEVDRHQDSIKEIRASHEEKLKEMEAHLKELEEKLSLEHRSTEAEKVKHTETKRLFALLQENFEKVSKQMDLQAKHHRAKSEEMNSRREADEKFLLEFDGMTAKKFDLEQRLEESEEKIKELMSEVETLKKDCESIPILKSQVEVYKKDLNNAALGKDAADVEFEKLKKQLFDLQSLATVHNRDSGSLERLRNKGKQKFSHYNGSRQQEGHSRSNPELIICPVCQFGFTDLQAAENHVNNCIDKKA